MIRILLASVMCVTLSSPVVAQKADFKTCLKLKDKIEKLTYLREQGGSARKMERWNRERRVHKDKFREYRCRNHGKTMRL